MSAWGAWRQASCWFRALSTIPGGPLLPWRLAPPIRPNGRILPYFTSTASPASPPVPPLPPEDNGVGRETTNAGPRADGAETTPPAAGAPAPTSQPGPEPPLAERLIKAPMPAHPSNTSVLVEPWRPLPIRSERDHLAHYHQRSVATQIRHNERRQRLDRSDVHWRELLQTISDMTPSRASWKAIRLETFDTTMPSSDQLRDLEMEIRTIMESTGCVILLDKSLLPIMAITVYCPPISLERAISAILETVRSAEVTDVRHELSPQDRSRLAELDAQTHPDPDGLESSEESHSAALPLALHTPQDVPKPEIWTKQNLEEYVERITHARLGKMARSIPNLRERYLSVVSTLLADVFNDEYARSSITLSSIHTALRYHARHVLAQRHDMRILFDFATAKLGLSPSTETFNIMLSGYAQAKDLAGFEAMVRRMKTYSCVPNLQTWLWMMTMIECGRVRQHILAVMRDKGMLDSQTVVRQLAKLNAAHHARAAMETKRRTTLGAFLNYQDRLYGQRKSWFTQWVANKTIDVFCEYGRFQDAFALAKRMHEPGRPVSAKPDAVTFTTILDHARIQRRLEVGVRAISWMERAHVMPNEVSFNSLFELVWEARRPMSVGVVWHYAALVQGSVSYRMRRRVGDVMHALGQGEPVDEGNKAVSRWEKQRSLASLVSTLPSQEALPTPPGCNEGCVPLDLMFAHKYAGYQPAEKLSELLRAALETDRKHHGKPVADGSDPEIPRRGIIDMRLRPGLSSRARAPGPTIRLEADYSIDPEDDSIGPAVDDLMDPEGDDLIAPEEDYTPLDERRRNTGAL